MEPKGADAPKSEGGTFLEKFLPRLRRKPLLKRPRGHTPKREIQDALDRLDSIALASAALGDVAQKADDLRGKPREKHDPERDRAMVDLAAAVYAARRSTYPEFIAQASFWASRLRDQRHDEGAYDGELEPIQEAMDAIRVALVGAESEPLYLADAPPEYRRLNDEYVRVLEGHTSSILREFGLLELADFREAEPKLFESLRTRGWRVFHARDQKEFAPAVRDIVVRCEVEARAAARSGAHFAALTMLGSAMEGQLLLRCLRSPAKAARIARQLDKKNRPDSPERPVRWTFEQLTMVCSAAGWLPEVETEFVRYDSASMADELRSKRNLIHPGVQARKRAWAGISEQDYKDALALYQVLSSGLAQ